MRWLTRLVSRDVRTLNTMSKVKGEAAEMWFRHYQRSLAERSRLVAENTALRTQLEGLKQQQGVPS